MASILDCYIAVNGSSEAAVKSEYGVSKANTLKVLKALLIAEIKPSASGRGKSAVRKPRKPRGPGKKKTGKKAGRPAGSKSLKPTRANARIETPKE
jgi:hypothetical protein